MTKERATVSGRDLANAQKAGGLLKTEASLAPTPAMVARAEQQLQNGTGMGQLQKTTRLKRREPTEEELAALSAGQELAPTEEDLALNDSQEGAVEIPELVDEEVAPAPARKARRAAPQQVQRPQPVIHAPAARQTPASLSMILGAKQGVSMSPAVPGCPLRTIKGFENCQPIQTELGNWTLKMRKIKPTLGDWQGCTDIQSETLMQVQTGIYYQSEVLRNGFKMAELPKYAKKHEQNVLQAVIDENHELVIMFFNKGNVLHIEAGMDIAEIYLF
jgi:hypothetical protein